MIKAAVGANPVGVS